MKTSQLPRWNWGAFFLSWIWGLANRAYIGLTMFMVIVCVGSAQAIVVNYLPSLNTPAVMTSLNYVILLYIFGISIAYGLHGYRWAWEKNPEQDLKRFRRGQRIWGVVGFCLWFMLITVLSVVFHWLTTSKIFNVSLDLAKNDPILQTYIGKPISVSLWSLRGEVSTSGAKGSAYYKFTAKGQWQSAVVVVQAVKQAGQWRIINEVAKVPNMGLKTGNTLLVLYQDKNRG